MSEEPPTWASKPTPTGQEIIYTVRSQPIGAGQPQGRTLNPFKRMWNKRQENLQAFKAAHNGLTPDQVGKRMKA